MASGQVQDQNDAVSRLFETKFSVPLASSGHRVAEKLWEAVKPKANIVVTNTAGARVEKLRSFNRVLAE